jgi:hypothetical protein
MSPEQTQALLQALADDVERARGSLPSMADAFPAWASERWLRVEEWDRRSARLGCPLDRADLEAAALAALALDCGHPGLARQWAERACRRRSPEDLGADPGLPSVEAELRADWRTARARSLAQSDYEATFGPWPGHAIMCRETP